MKTIILLLTIMWLILPNRSFALSTTNDVNMEQKIYVKPDQLIFGNREIFVYLSGEWVIVNSIHSDDLGLYIKPVVSNYPWSRWICRACNYNNPGDAKFCTRDYPIKCREPRPEG